MAFCSTELGPLLDFVMDQYFTKLQESGALEKSPLLHIKRAAPWLPYPVLFDAALVGNRLALDTSGVSVPIRGLFCLDFPRLPHEPDYPPRSVLPLEHGKMVELTLADETLNSLAYTAFIAGFLDTSLRTLTDRLHLSFNLTTKDFVGSNIRSVCVPA